MIQKLLLAMALPAALGVAGGTVHLQVRARLCTYDLARARVAIVELGEACDVLRVRAARQWTPERIAQAAARLRMERERAAAMAAAAAAAVPEL